MLNFFIGWVLGLITLCIGLFIGMSLGKIEKKIVQIKSKLTPPPTESGPVKPYTPEEKEELDNLEHRRMRELL